MKTEQSLRVPETLGGERVSAAAMLLLFSAVGGLVALKAASAMGAIGKAQASGGLSPKAALIDLTTLPAVVRPLAGAVNYLSWVVVALTFGVLIGAMARAFVPGRWLERTVAGDGVRGQMLAALVGAPLMLCSCCVAPVFEGVYERTRRLGPALAVMLAAPALNPAVLVVTFLVFPSAMAWTRLSAAVLLVLLAGPLLGRAYRDPRPAVACPIDVASPSLRLLAAELGASLKSVALRSLPAILLGVVISAAIAGALPSSLAATSESGALGRALVVVVVALIAVPLALPTFGEVPLALGLIAAGAPDGAALAMLVAGPAINLPSMLSLGRATSPRVGVGAGVMVLVVAVSAGLLV